MSEQQPSKFYGGAITRPIIGTVSNDQYEKYMDEALDVLADIIIDSYLKQLNNPKKDS